MCRPLLLFDLDGTLTDSAPGITGTVRAVLEEMGYPAYSQEVLNTFVGPPLRDSYRDIVHMTETDTEKAIALFQKKYDAGGKFASAVYPWMPEVLSLLKKDGFILGVASSKPEKFVRQILAHFQLTPFFSAAAGATMDEKIVEKPDIIEMVLRDTGYADRRELVCMIGDRMYDMTGAADCGIRKVGVLWGYGSRAELERAGADQIAENGEMLLQILRDAFIDHV